MQHQLSNSNASSTIGRVKSSPTGNRASARVARFAETEATCAMQFKQTRDFSNVKPEASERIRLVETALRAAAQRSAPQASSGAGVATGSFPRERRRLPGRANVSGKSRIVALISLAFVLPSLRAWLFGSACTPLADVSQQSQFIPSPVLTAPAFLEATAGENILLSIALDGTDGVPAHSSIAITGLPQGSTLV